MGKQWRSQLSRGSRNAGTRVEASFSAVRGDPLTHQEEEKGATGGRRELNACALGQVWALDVATAGLRGKSRPTGWPSVSDGAEGPCTAGMALGAERDPPDGREGAVTRCMHACTSLLGSGRCHRRNKDGLVPVPWWWVELRETGVAGAKERGFHAPPAPADRGSKISRQGYR